MIEWPIVKLGDVTDLVSGFPFASSDYVSATSGVRLLRGDNVVQGRLRWDGVKRWPADRLDGLDRYSLERGDVILAMDRPWIEAGLKYAAITEADLPALLVQRVSRLRGSGRLLTSFLRYVIGSPAFTDYVLSVQTGTAVPHISGGQIRAYEFKLPSLDEQRAIVDVVGAIDEKVEANLRTADTADEFGRAMVATVDEMVALSEIAVSGRELLDPRGSGLGLVEHFSIPALDGGGPETVRAESIQSTKAVLPERCVVVSRLNPAIPRTWFVSHDGSLPALASTEFAILIGRRDIDPELIYPVCSQPAFFRYLGSKVTGTSTSHQRVSLEDVLAAPVQDPRMLADEQRVTVRDTVQLAAVLRHEARHLGSVRNTLMPLMLDGRVRVDGSDRPLERAT